MLPALLLLLANPSPPRIAVLDVKPRVGVTPELAQGITDDVVVEVRRRNKDSAIISSEEIRSMLGFAQQKQKLGCQEMSCLAEIGGALGADLLVIGTLSRFGSTYLLSLQLIETRAARVKEEASLKLTGKDEELLDGVSRAVQQLFPGSVPAPAIEGTPAVALKAPPARSHAARWVFLGVAGAAAVGAAIGGGLVLDYVGFNNGIASGSTVTTVAAAQSRQSSANAWGTAGLVLAGVAVASGVGAVVTW